MEAEVQALDSPSSAEPVKADVEDTPADEYLKLDAEIRGHADPIWIRQGFLGFRVWGVGFRVEGLGYRVQGLGFRV